GVEYTLLQHLHNDVKQLLSKLPSETLFLDGELYLHNIERDVISGVARAKLKPHKDTKMMKYFIYDINIPDMEFKDRYKLLKKYLKNIKTLELVPCYNVDNQEELYAKHKEFTDNNYEGTVLRVMDKLYE